MKWLIININLYESRVGKTAYHLTSAPRLTSDSHTKPIKSTNRSVIAIQRKFCSSEAHHDDLDDDFLPLFPIISFWKVPGVHLRLSSRLDDDIEWAHQQKWDILRNCHYYCSIVYLDQYNCSLYHNHMEGQESQGTSPCRYLLFRQRLLLGTFIFYQEYRKISISTQYSLGCTLDTILYGALRYHPWLLL